MPGRLLQENRALIIGVGKYQVESNNLPGIDKDVQMARKIAQALGFKPQQIKVVMDEQATLENIGVSINNWLITGTTKNDRVFFLLQWARRTNSRYRTG